MRISKTPEERKNELILEAEKQFVEKGYDGTLISDIVREVGVAQGTFYYYFKSKEDILYAILEQKLNDYGTKMLKACESKELDAVEKMKIVFQMMFETQGEEYGRIQYLMVNSSKIVHEQLDAVRTKTFYPIVKTLVLEGIEEKLFPPIDYPEEVTEIVFVGITKYMHKYSPQFGDSEVRTTKLKALEEVLERSMGLKKGTFQFI